MNNKVLIGVGLVGLFILMNNQKPKKKSPKELGFTYSPPVEELEQPDREVPGGGTL
jgi:hypothetical protein